MIKEPSLYVSLAVHREQVAELDQANTELNITISQHEAEKMRLLEILAENEEYHLAIMTEKCPTDEVHCTCVPTLRAENKRLREDAQELAETLYAASSAVRYLLPNTRAKVIDVHNRVGKHYIPIFEGLEQNTPAR
jgi:hypothetical protein